MTVTLSFTGARELRIGGRSSVSCPPDFSVFGVQRDMSAPIGIKTYPSLRTGRAGVLSSAVAAGTIASSNGSASATPAPRRNLRRGNAFLVSVIVSVSCLALVAVPAAKLLLSSTHAERNTVYNSNDKR